MFTRVMVVALSYGALTFGCAFEPATDNADDIQETVPIGNAASVTVAISVSTANTIVIDPSSLTVVSGQLVTFTSTVAGNLTVPADIFGNVGPLSLTAGGVQRVPVLPNAPVNTSGQARFTTSSNPNLNGPITIGTGIGIRTQ